MTDDILDAARYALKAATEVPSEDRNYVQTVEEVPEGHEAHRGEEDGIFWVDSGSSAGGSGDSSGGQGSESSGTGEPEDKPSDAPEDDEDAAGDDGEGEMDPEDESEGSTVREADPEEFAESVQTMIEENPEKGAYLTEHPPEELEDHTLLMPDAGGAGAAVSPEGDAQNLHNHNGPDGIGRKLIEETIENGGRTLDCYDGFLVGLYEQYGFVETGRMDFVAEFAPDGLEYDEDNPPDVVFMAYQPEAEAETTDERFDTDEWDAAKDISREAAQWDDQ